jgi:hypothetical protein
MAIYYRLASITILSVALVGVVLRPARVAAANDLSGTWRLSMSFPDKGITNMQLPEMTLKQTGTTITGTMSGTEGVKGTSEGSNVSLTITFNSPTGNGGTVFKGTIVNANSMQGKVNMLQLGPGNWTASR